MVTRRVLLQFQPSIRGRTRPVNGGVPCSGGDGAKDDGGRLVIPAGTQALIAVKRFPWRERDRERKRLHDGRCKTEVGKSRILLVGQEAEVPSTAPPRVSSCALSPNRKKVPVRHFSPTSSLAFGTGSYLEYRNKLYY